LGVKPNQQVWRKRNDRRKNRWTKNFLAGLGGGLGQGGTGKRKPLANRSQDNHNQKKHGGQRHRRGGAGGSGEGVFPWLTGGKKKKKNGSKGGVAFRRQPATRGKNWLYEKSDGLRKEKHGRRGPGVGDSWSANREKNSTSSWKGKGWVGPGAKSNAPPVGRITKA